jgi:hypothetical protein
MRRACGVAALLWLSVSPGLAQFAVVLQAQCPVLTAPTPGALPLVNETLTRFPNIAFRICDDQNGTHYHVRAPAEPVDGVCIFRQSEVEPDRADAPVLDPGDQNYRNFWYTPPRPWILVRSWQSASEFMQLSNGECPALNDPNHVLVRNVSPGTFKAANALLTRLFSSQADFDAATTDRTRCNPPQGSSPALENRMRQSRDGSIAGLRASLFDRHQPYKIVSIAFFGTSGLFSGFEIYIEATGVADTIRTSPYRAIVDFADGELRVKCFDPLYTT